jgi:rare lipoprotein A
MKTIILILLSACFIFNGVKAQDTTKAKPKTTVKKKAAVSVITGIASFYSQNLEGSPTSSGERFTHSKYTCASNHIKLGSWIRVTNIANGKSVIVKVNDRMHPRMAKRGRVVDLTISAFKAIGNLNSGLLKVKVENFGKNKPK